MSPHHATNTSFSFAGIHKVVFKIQVDVIDREMLLIASSLQKLRFDRNGCGPTRCDVDPPQPKSRRLAMTEM